MDTLKNRLHILTIIAIFTLAWSINSSRGMAAPGTASAFAPVSPTFAYEGRLSTLSGRYDFKFRLFNAPSGGSLVSPIERAVSNVPVDSGEYLVNLSFGTNVFTGEARYLEVQYRVSTTDASVPYKLLSGRPHLLAVPYAQSLRPGATVSGNVPYPGAVVRGTNTGTGIGLAGTTATGLWGVYGENTSPTGGAGVQGISTNGYGVRGNSTNSQGVWGTSQGSHGVVGKSVVANGVYGETSAAHTASNAGVYGKSSGNGGIGVIGEARVGNTWGVYGITEQGIGVVGAAQGTGIGVSGSGTFGYAMQADGNAKQRLTSGGWVKAMALISADGSVEQCFNAQLTSINATLSPCGITVTRGFHPQGDWNVNFGFQVDNRFISITPFNRGDSIAANIQQELTPSSTTVHVRTTWSFRDHGSGGSEADAPFFIIVY